MCQVEVESMAYKFRDYDLEQPFLIAPDIRDWVSDDHLARFVDDAVSVLDLSSFKQKYRAGKHGRSAYDPAMMLRVVLYCFCRGIFSSRKMEEATVSDIGARYLAANQHPDHTCFFKFHKRHQKNIKNVFVEVVGLCRQMGLQNLGHVAIDGTVIKANSSRSKCIEIAKLDDLIASDEELVQGLLANWEATDDKEKDTREIPKELRTAKSRLKALKRAKEHIESLTQTKQAELKEVSEAEMSSREDLDARCRALQPEGAPDLAEARLQQGFTQSQLAEKVGMTRGRLSTLETGKRYPNDEESAKITQVLGQVRFAKTPADSISSEDSEAPEVKVPGRFVNLTEPECPIIKRKGKPGVQGYNAQFAVDSKYQVVVALGVSTKTTDHSNFIPMIEELMEINEGRKPKEASADCGYHALDVIESPLLDGIDVCIPPQRRKTQPKNPHPATQRMRDKADSEHGKRMRTQRGATVEPAFGQVKGPMGFTQFLGRGEASVTYEWTLVGICHNLLKIMRYKWK